MKQIKNWEAVLEEDETDVIAIPLPGCIIIGEIELENIRIKAVDVDLSHLTITDENNEQYLLLGARQEYLNKLEEIIEIGKQKRINKEKLDSEISKNGYEL